MCWTADLKQAGGRRKEMAGHDSCAKDKYDCQVGERADWRV